MRGTQLLSDKRNIRCALCPLPPAPPPSSESHWGSFSSISRWGPSEEWWGQKLGEQPLGN